MIKPDPTSPKLTEHDREVLRRIIEQSKVTDSQIAKGMSISPQAVSKIRNKLESVGIIKGYMPVLDLRKIGISVLAVLVIRLTDKAWSKYSDDAISDRITRMPYIIEAYRVSDVHASHILLMGFRDFSQKEEYLRHIQTKYAEQIEIKAVYTLSVDKMIVRNPLGLLQEIIDKKDLQGYGFFPSEKEKR